MSAVKRAVRTVAGTLKTIFAHPATRGLRLDDRRTTERRRHIIQSKKFLWRIYDEWYGLIADCIPEGPGYVLELGSGPGFLAQYVPGVITSDVFACTGIRVILDARSLPFVPGSLKAIALVEILHHVPDARAFFVDAARCLRPGGTVVMIEPWVSTWSKLVYSYLHHEAFDPAAKGWTLPGAAPLSIANGAMPWNIFVRDRKQFEAEFPDLRIQRVQPFMPFRYLVSGGVSLRGFMPGWTFDTWKKIERSLEKWPDRWPMFALIQLRRR